MFLRPAVTAVITAKLLTAQRVRNYYCTVKQFTALSAVHQQRPLATLELNAIY